MGGCANLGASSSPPAAGASIPTLLALGCRPWGVWRVEERTTGRGKCDVRPEQELLAALEAGDMPTDGVLLWHVLQSVMKKKKKKNRNENRNRNKNYNKY
jgi:hypothetical protein